MPTPLDRLCVQCCRTALTISLTCISHINISATPIDHIQYALDPSYDHIPITPKTWQAVKLSYTSTIKGKNYINSIQFLRPIQWLKKHYMLTKGQAVMITMPEFGITEVNATVTAIDPTTVDTRSMHWATHHTTLVIGIFKRYVTDVRTYTLKDHAGHISDIKATPNHPFYVQNKAAFLAIGNITDTDQLIGINHDHHRTMHLVCTHGQHQHCGKPYLGKTMAVYNLELYRHHVFTTGTAHLLVHNGCPDIHAVKVGPYKLLGPLQKNDFQPKILRSGAWINDDTSHYAFETSPRLPQATRATLKQWQKYVTSPDESIRNAGRFSLAILADKSVNEKLFSLARYKGNLIGISMFSKQYNSWDLAYSFSDPSNLTAIALDRDGAYRGFGGTMSAKGIEAIREMDNDAVITSKAITKTAAIIKTRLGFTYSPLRFTNAIV